MKRTKLSRPIFRLGSCSVHMLLYPCNEAMTSALNTALLTQGTHAPTAHTSECCLHLWFPCVFIQLHAHITLLNINTEQCSEEYGTSWSSVAATLTCMGHYLGPAPINDIGRFGHFWNTKRRWLENHPSPLCEMGCCAPGIFTGLMHWLLNAITNKQLEQQDLQRRPYYYNKSVQITEFLSSKLYN